MHPDFAPRPLGRTGFVAGRMGLAASYGCPADIVERAFDLGVNYFFYGSLRRYAFAEGLRRLAPRRAKYAVVVQSYTRMAALLGWSVERALREIRSSYADVLLLGLWNKPVRPSILDAAIRLRDRGLVRWLAVSTHHRPLVPEIAASSPYDIVHFRYNAVHPGAESDIFPKLPPAPDRPGMVAFTATSWKQLLNPKYVMPGERTPTAADCYRFVLSHRAVDVCTAGPKNAAEFEAVAEALDRGPLDPAESEWLRTLGRRIYLTEAPGFLRR